MLFSNPKNQYFGCYSNQKTGNTSKFFAFQQSQKFRILAAIPSKRLKLAYSLISSKPKIQDSTFLEISAYSLISSSPKNKNFCCYFRQKKPGNYSIFFKFSAPQKFRIFAAIPNKNTGNGSVFNNFWKSKNPGFFCYSEQKNGNCSTFFDFQRYKN